MPEKITAEDFMNNIIEKLTDSIPRQKSISFFEEDKSNSVASQFNRLFGRQKPVHNLLGGGKSADVLLWRNKKISAGVLATATAIWILFEWLNYHFLTLVAFALILCMLAQFLWANAACLLNRSSSRPPRLVIPDELFTDGGKLIGVEVNHVLKFLQDVAAGGNLRQFLLVVGGLWAAAVIGSWCNFLTVLYIGFVAAHTLPLLYERYDDQVDGFVYQMGQKLQHHYRKVNSGFLNKIPKGKFIAKKFN
ncbi:hypothetical protein SAY87_030338 [Trapa incisa]|uniref:Reticulon-like protein n=1 Tax=Trapa incisa TaxID=236973 RepID=A0AAN7KUZ3_9MYRT|nr:hypothetical protein SAY87_030338 [Trapa incisa]